MIVCVCVGGGGGGGGVKLHEAKGLSTMSTTERLTCEKGLLASLSQ